MQNIKRVLQYVKQFYKSKSDFFKTKYLK